MALQSLSPLAFQLAWVATASMPGHRVDFVRTWLAWARKGLDRPACRSMARHASFAKLSGSVEFCPSSQILFEFLLPSWVCSAHPLPLPFVAADCGGSHAPVGSEAGPRTRTSSQLETDLSVSRSAASLGQAGQRDLALLGSWDHRCETALLAPCSVAPPFFVIASKSLALVALVAAFAVAAHPAEEKPWVLLTVD